jgi:hypothetical protein
VIRAEVAARRDVLRDVAQTLQKAPGLMNTAFRLEERRISRDMKAELKVKGNLPQHPFKWSLDQEKQRRAQRYYFWAVREGIIRTVNGRYARSGKRSEGWKIRFMPNDDGSGYLLAENKEPGAVYVFGLRQVPSHKLSKWPYAPLIFTKYRRLSTQRIREIHRTVLDPRAGVR